MAEEVDERKKDPFVIEFGRKLSESALWKANAHYYKSMGTMAFQFLPPYATMNCFLARSYANLVLSYLRECLLVCFLSFLSKKRVTHSASLFVLSGLAERFTGLG